MHWFFIALIAPLIWSILNHTDKYLISKYARHTGVGGLVVYSSLFAVFALPIIWMVDPGVLQLGSRDALMIMLTGVFAAAAILLYLYALDRDDASVVVPFMFLIPIFAYFLGVAMLGEQVSGAKLIGSAIALMGALILSLKFDEGVSIRKGTVVLMVVASLFMALSDVIFKGQALEGTFWQSAFWNQVGMVAFGVCCLVFVSRYRRDFWSLVKVKSLRLLSLNVFGEIGQTAASLVNYYATLLAPVALVLLVGYTFQPLFVFLEGLLITLFFPAIAQENISRGHIIQKLVSIAIMSVGVYLVTAA